MNKIIKISAILLFIVFYSSQSFSAGTAKNLKCKGCVGTKDLAKNAVTSSRIRDGSVTVNDLSLELRGEINEKQDRVTGVCPPGQSIGSINADGTVACEADTDTLSALSCTTDQYIKWNGSAWVCSDASLRSIYIGADSMQPKNGAIRDSDGKIILPEASGVAPGFSTTFIIPGDYRTGSNFIMRLVFQSTATQINQFGTVQITAERSLVSPPTAAPIFENIASTSANFVFINGLAFGANAVYLFEGTFTGASFSPGRAVSLVWARDTQEPLFDTHTGDIRVFAVDVMYSANL